MIDCHVVDETTLRRYFQRRAVVILRAGRSSAFALREKEQAFSFVLFDLKRSERVSSINGQMLDSRSSYYYDVGRK
jgi:hypothetical protein